jgi:hypothetical protein
MLVRSERGTFLLHVPWRHDIVHCTTIKEPGRSLSIISFVSLYYSFFLSTFFASLALPPGLLSRFPLLPSATVFSVFSYYVTTTSDRIRSILLMLLFCFLGWYCLFLCSLLWWNCLCCFRLLLLSWSVVVIIPVVIETHHLLCLMCYVTNNWFTPFLLLTTLLSYCCYKASS